MKKIYAIIAGFCIIIVVLLSFYQNTLNIATARGNFYHLLPKSSAMLFTTPSLLQIWEKFDPEKHSDIIQAIQIQSQFSFGWDISNLELLEKRGISLTKPAGMALLDRKMGTMAFFIGISEPDKFKDFLEDQFQKDNTEEKKENFFRTRIYEHECLVDGTLENPDAIHCLYHDYWIIYGTRNLLFRENLMAQFASDIFSEQDRLQTLPLFQKISGDVSIYLSQPALAEVLLNLKMEKDNPILSWYKDCTGICCNLDWQPNNLSLSFFLSMEEQKNSDIVQKNIHQTAQFYLGHEKAKNEYFQIQATVPTDETPSNIHSQQITFSSKEDILQQILSYLQK